MKKLFLFFFLSGILASYAQNPIKTDSLQPKAVQVQLFTTYTFTIISAGPLTDKNVQEIEDLFKGLPTILYLNINPKTKQLIVQVQDTPKYPKLVSSEIKQIVLELGDYELNHEFSVEEKPALTK